MVVVTQQLLLVGGVGAHVFTQSSSVLLGAGAATEVMLLCLGAL